MMAIDRIRPVALVLASVFLLPHSAAGQVSPRSVGDHATTRGSTGVEKELWLAKVAVVYLVAYGTVRVIKHLVKGPEGIGGLRLKVTPRNAEVFVDGQFAGLVDEFDGVRQRLPISPGPHHIEIRAPRCEPLTYDILIHHRRTNTVEGALKTIR
jgi:hypothetical protein